MTKLTFKTIADKYKLYEEDIEWIFACYDTNDMAGLKSAIEYCFFTSYTSSPSSFLFDIICYIKQCEMEMEEEGVEEE